jgi:hypothetical protein
MDKKEIIIGAAGVAIATAMFFKQEHLPHTHQEVEKAYQKNITGFDVYNFNGMQKSRWHNYVAFPTQGICSIINPDGLI